LVEKRSRRVVLVALVWLVVAGGAALLYKLVIAPGRAEDELRRTGTPSRFSATVRIAHDSFSGYCLLRSEDLAARMSDRGVRLEFTDDGADYAARLAALRDGDVDLAVFTIDALLKASAALAEFPATIVLVTFTLLSFTSLVPELSISKLRHLQGRGTLLRRGALY